MDIKTCTTLLEEVIEIESHHRVALAFATDPTFAYLLARSVAHVDVYDLSYSALARLEYYIGGKATNLTVHQSPYPPTDGAYDAVLMLADKGRDYSRAHLWRAVQALQPQGALYIAGESQRGTKTIISDAEDLFHNANTATYKRRHRVGVAYKLEDFSYPAAWGEPPPDVMRLVDYHMPNGNAAFYAQPGVFSWEELDDGTRYLMDSINFAEFDSLRVLDMGCGAGVLGWWAAQHGADVVLADDNLLAVDCTRATLEHHGMVNASVLASDVFSTLAEEKFDVIISNPPFHRSFDVNTNVAHRIIRAAPGHLQAGGRLVLVANAFLKYDTAAGEHFRSVRTMDNGKYKIIDSRL